jgi:cyclophilin family peptidyl-prolyl cis-trans isomerase/HEAT repeat protein
MKAAAAILTVGIAVAAAFPTAAQRIIAPRGSGNAVPGFLDHQKRAAVLAIEDGGAPRALDLDLLLAVARGSGRRGDSGEALQLRRLALRSLGRLERAEMIPALMAARQDPEVRGAAETALLLTLRANAAADGLGEQIAQAVDALLDTASPLVLGQLPYVRNDQFMAAEQRLRAALERNDETSRFFAARGLEALARRNRKLGRLSDETLSVLTRCATWNLIGLSRPRGGLTVQHCFAALISAGAVDGLVAASALSENTLEHRRLGALALYGAGASLGPEERTALIQQALGDRRGLVRYDALRAWVRHEAATHGCDPIVAALADEDMHVALLAIDSLADQCRGGEVGEAISIRLTGELGTPPNVGSWHREAHALVAMAHRDPERARLALPFFTRHVTWQVRMYAARAAAILDNGPALEMLASDADANVREAALPGLHRLKAAGASAALISALGSDNYQLVRTAAMLLQGAVGDRKTQAAVIASLQRITAQRKDTSRDIRLVLLQRIREFAREEDGPTLEPFLKDFDPMVANEVAHIYSAVTGRAASPSPQPLMRSNLPTAAEFMDLSNVRVLLDNGRSFDIAPHRADAPLAATRFLRLVKARYYNGLTFHRVVPNFVVQGGSPGANEYDGDSQFMRDELGGTHQRGAVGISTRGHHTGDAQLFINLVSNVSLDFDYTVVGTITPQGMDVVDTIVEGTKISRMTLVAPAPPR